MKRSPQVGLIVEGNSTKSTVLRLPNLADEIGPVKSAVLRVARRVANFLRAGFAVNDYAELRNTRLILIRAPDEAVSRIVEELCESGLELRGLVFVLCESWLVSDVLRPLQENGASIATLVAVSGARRPWFLIEGQSAAVRQIRRLLESSGARGLEIRQGTKHLYFAAKLLSTAIPIPLFLTAQQAMRGTGISGKNLYTVMEEMTQSMLSEFLKGGRAAWGGPIAECSPEVADRLFAALRMHDPEVASIVDRELAWARGKMSKRSGR